MHVVGTQKTISNRNIVNLIYEMVQTLDKYVVLDTCQRVEVYIDQDQPVPQISGTYNISCKLEIYQHLFKVASSLLAPVIGETEIQGQVKNAYKSAIDSGTITPTLHDLFQKALFIGKKVRRESNISYGTLSYVGLVFSYMKNHCDNINALKIGLIGYGQLSKDFIFLAKKNNLTITFLLTRSVDKVDTSFNHTCEVISSKDSSSLSDKLMNVDIVISASSDPNYVITPDAMPKNKSLLLFDLASPADIDPSVRFMNGVDLVDLEKIVNQKSINSSQRHSEVEKVEQIIADEMSNLSKELCACHSNELGKNKAKIKEGKQ